MSEDNFDIYGDLEALDREVERKTEEKANKLKDEEIKVLTEKTTELEKQLEKMKEENLSVKKNFYAYMEISRKELERRSNDVATLRKQNDDLIFKRNEKGGIKVTNKVDKEVQVDIQIEGTDLILKETETKCTQTEERIEKSEKININGHHSRTKDDRHDRNDSRKDKYRDYKRSDSRRHDSSSYSKYSKNSRDSKRLNDDRSSRSGSSSVSRSLKRKRDSKSSEKSTESVKPDAKSSKYETKCKKVYVIPKIVDDVLSNKLDEKEKIVTSCHVNIGKDTTMEKIVSSGKEVAGNLEEKLSIDSVVKEPEPNVKKLEIPLSVTKMVDTNHDSKKDKIIDNTKSCEETDDLCSSTRIKRKRDSKSSDRSFKQIKLEEKNTKVIEPAIESIDVPKIVDEKICEDLELDEKQTMDNDDKLVENVEKEINREIACCNNNNMDNTEKTVIIEDNLSIEKIVIEPVKVVKIVEKMETPLSVSECVKILLAQVSDNSSDDEIYPVVETKNPVEKMNVSAVYAECDDDLDDSSINVSNPKDDAENNKLNNNDLELVDPIKDSLVIDDKLEVLVPIVKSIEVDVKQVEVKQAEDAVINPIVLLTKCVSHNSAATPVSSIIETPTKTTSRKKVHNSKKPSKPSVEKNQKLSNSLCENTVTNNILEISINNIKDNNTTQEITENNLNKAKDNSIALSPNSTYVVKAISNKVVNVFIKRKTSKIKK